MSMDQYALYFLAVSIAVLTPGPAVMLGISNSIRYGIPSSAIAAAGCVTGTGLMAVLSALGLGAVIMTSGVLFTIIHYVGAAYLIWLGIKMWRESKSQKDGFAATSVASEKSPTALRLYMQGVVVSISNPKAIAFFTALFPLFIDQNTALAGQFAVLAMTFVVMSFSAIMGYALLASRSRQFLVGSGRRWFQRISGGIFISFGIGLAASSR